MIPAREETAKLLSSPPAALAVAGAHWDFCEGETFSLAEFMEFFPAKAFIEFAVAVRRFLAIKVTVPDAPIGPSEMSNILETFKAHRDNCIRYGFAGSAAKIERVLNLKNATHGEIHERIDRFYESFIDDLESRMFLALSQREAAEFKGPRVGWERIISAFKDSVRDIEEAGKCLALGRSTAAVFHLMRVIEHGLLSFAGSLGVDSAVPSWDGILKKCDAEIVKRWPERSPEFKANREFYARATSALRAVQHAWRNPTMHVEGTYTIEQAREVLTTVQMFMNLMAEAPWLQEGGGDD